MYSTVSPRGKEHIRSAPSRNNERHTLAENIPSRIIFQQGRNCKISPSSSQDVRSRYCSTELSKTEPNCRLSRIDSAPPVHVRGRETRDSAPTAEDLRMRDVMFLRKMLAINKKQEMMLNKRLARLLEEEEFQTLNEGRQKSKQNIESLRTPPPKVDLKVEQAKESTSATDVEDEAADTNCGDTARSIEATQKEEKITLVETKQDEIVAKTIPARKVQYDINGRRIYYYSDIEKDITDEEYEQKRPVITWKTKRVDSSSKIKKGSTSSKKTFTMKKSLTYISTHSRLAKKSVVKSKGKGRKEDGDSPNCVDYNKALDFELKPKKAGCQGDGGRVQNVVVHCSRVLRDNSTSRKNIKVWNYESLPSLMPGNSLEKNKPVCSVQRLQEHDCKVNSRQRPISGRNNNIEMHFKHTPTRNDDKGSTVETVFLDHKKLNDV